MRHLSRAIVVTAVVIVASACGSTPLPPTTTPSSTSIAPPRVISPINDQQVETRPWLTVENAISGNRYAILTYRFDVSPSPAFKEGLVSTTVFEGNPGGRGSTETTALLPAELALGTRYYWRAQAVDGASGVASAFTPTATFSTFGPRPGLSMLHVSTTACNSGIGVTFDGTLTSDGTVARFVVPDGLSAKDPTLTLEFSRASPGWSGRIFGDGVGRDANEIEIAPGSPGAALSVQASDAYGRWVGSFDGNVGIWNRYHDGGICSDHFTWVILPPR